MIAVIQAAANAINITTFFFTNVRTAALLCCVSVKTPPKYYFRNIIIPRGRKCNIIFQNILTYRAGMNGGDIFVKD